MVRHEPSERCSVIPTTVAGTARRRLFQLLFARFLQVDAIVDLASGAADGTFHLCGPRPLPLAKFWAFMRKRGYKLRIVPYDEWRAMLTADAARGNALEALVPTLAQSAEGMGTKETMPRFESSRTRETLVALGGNPCPTITEEYLSRCFDYYESSGFLERPRRGSA